MLDDRLQQYLQSCPTGSDQADKQRHFRKGLVAQEGPVACPEGLAALEPAQPASQEGQVAAPLHRSRPSS